MDLCPSYTVGEAKCSPGSSVIYQKKIKMHCVAELSLQSNQLFQKQTFPSISTSSAAKWLKDIPDKTTDNHPLPSPIYWNPDCRTLPLVYHKKPHQPFSIQNCSSLNCGFFIVAALLTYSGSELRCLKQGLQRDLSWGDYWVLPPPFWGIFLSWLRL